MTTLLGITAAIAWILLIIFARDARRNLGKIMPYLCAQHKQTQDRTNPHRRNSARHTTFTEETLLSSILFLAALVCTIAAIA